MPRWQLPSTLPPLYAGWMAELLDGAIPAETAATCEQCAMCSTGETSPATLEFFDPATKCCTYIPSLPNFLVGRILDDHTPETAAGRASVERRIDARVGVTPLGVQTPQVQALLYEAGGVSTFGRTRALRCPHYREEAGGACGIWRNRNAVCSTWFCKHVRGATGQRFWHAQEQLLATIERELARWCLVRLDVEPEVLARLMPRGESRRARTTTLDAAAADGRVDEAAFAASWGRWRGRERELYRAAATAVAELDWPEVLRIAGGSGQAHARVTASAYRALMAEDIPERLVAASLRVITMGRDHVRVAAYNDFDPLDLPRILFDVLPSFDGRPTADVLRAIRVAKRLNVETALVRRLVDFGVLVEAGAQGRGRSGSPSVSRS